MPLQSDHTTDSKDTNTSTSTSASASASTDGNGSGDTSTHNRDTYWPPNVPSQSETPLSGLALLAERYRAVLGGEEIPSPSSSRDEC